jgi:ribosomal protein S16
VTNNQQRAGELAQHVGIYDPTEIRQALDAAEARGRAEVAAKVREFADELAARDPQSAIGIARELRALVAGETS